MAEKIWGLLGLALSLVVAGCSGGSITSDLQETAGPAPQAVATQEQEAAPMQDEQPPAAEQVTATINGVEFTLELDDTPAAQAFVELLPLTAEMSELNGNEKYLYLDEPLPTDPYRPQTIEAGDAMLYGDDCLVVFYETFPTSYSYTRIGRLTNAEGLAEAAGPGSASVEFSKV